MPSVTSFGRRRSLARAISPPDQLAAPAPIRYRFAHHGNRQRSEHGTHHAGAAAALRHSRAAASAAIRLRSSSARDWQKTHWFFTAAERDRVLEDMSRKHEYSRIGDQPALVFEKVEKLAESRGL